MLQISWEEPIIPFSPIPPFIVLIWVPPCNDVEVGKSIDQISIPSSQPSSISHDLDPSEDNLEWFMNHIVKNNPSIQPDGINTHNTSLEFYFDYCLPLSSLSYDPLPLEPLD